MRILLLFGWWVFMRILLLFGSRTSVRISRSIHIHIFIKLPCRIAVMFRPRVYRVPTSCDEGRMDGNSDLYVVEPNGEVTELQYDTTAGRHWGYRYMGVFMVDSFAMVRGPSAWQAYLVLILRIAMHLSGDPAAAVVCPGASFGNGKFARAYHRIRPLFARPRWMVWLAMGNDLYPPGTPVVVEQVWDLGSRLIAAARSWCPNQRLVFGGSSQLWRYHLHFPAALCDAYDHYVREAADMYTGNAIPCISGDSVFAGIVTADRIGHVSYRSLRELSLAFGMLATWAASPFPYGDMPAKHDVDVSESVRSAVKARSQYALRARNSLCSVVLDLAAQLQGRRARI